MDKLVYGHQKYKEWDTAENAFLFSLGVTLGIFIFTKMSRIVEMDFCLSKNANIYDSWMEYM